MAGMILVYRYRVKSLDGLLNKQSRAVNSVWHFCNDTRKHALNLQGEEDVKGKSPGSEARRACASTTTRAESRWT